MQCHHSTQSMHRPSKSRCGSTGAASTGSGSFGSCAESNGCHWQDR